ncbi:GspE/PulE family protein [Allopusillimonas ginsengisoli]|uniref:GspE/PulE family protein n=1 Tax=Allopusillimonas ginsengisoli TaxID=453575 RepID=UPI001021DD79|nr:ATPase, T2SS/T4P/T4SS family [Allopusillimonas ginsengisoli]TEA77342.1 general secretion pathway protein [Allopusillimonas ginsengisoli]
MIFRILARGPGRTRQSRSAARFDTAQARVVSSTQELALLPNAVVRSLASELNVVALTGRMVPVLMEDTCVAIFALAEHVGSDQADELAQRIVQAGYAAATPARYVVPAPLLLAISRHEHQQIVAGSALTQRPEQTRTALVAAFHDLVAWAVRHHASDIHLNVRLTEDESEIKYTVSGRYVAPHRFLHMPTRTLMDMLAVAWMDVRGGNGAVFDPFREQQGNLEVSLDGKRHVLRWASVAADAGPSVCLRVLPRDTTRLRAGLAGLGYLPDQLDQIQRVLLSQGGAVIFAGTVGSGKSTSLAALICTLAPHRKVLTLEDPVEYSIPGAIQSSILRNLDETAHTAYGSKLRALKRSAMSDVLLGEIRDRETGRAFVDLAASGVNVYTTVHAPSAALIPARLASDFIGVPSDFLAMHGVLKLLVYQALLPALCGHCAQPASILQDKGGRHPGGAWRSAAQWRTWLTLVQRLYGGGLDALRIRNTEGCPECRQSGIPDLYGYAGRVLVAEIIEPALSPHAVQTAMDCAVAKAFLGLVDPRDIELRFHAFETRGLVDAMNQRSIVQQPRQPMPRVAAPPAVRPCDEGYS